jgi:NADH-quinone oxidoreductase subunit L
MWLIPSLPLLAAVATAFLGPRFFRQASHWPCVAGVAGAFLLSIGLFISVLNQKHALLASYYTWFQAGLVDVGFNLRADGLTAIMLVTVTFVSTLIAIYSIGYMRGDPGYARYFAEISLFVFSMTGLVMADNFLLLYAFWEGVGLCSYLLIGFWFARPSAAAAARKAFLVTRLGDLGFIIGIILLWAVFGHRLDFDSVFAQGAQHRAWLPAICLLLFCGAVGKSAQFPLHVWLPDAMEGPSPVSALIHAATMVTAGVYMVARCMPLFHLVPGVLVIVAAIGAFTALLASLIALTQNDLKRVLAYSTISQLGYMFLALGSGITSELVPLAAVAAIFHLFTHAFFKALLFLAAGSVMHAMNDVIDMRRFSGLRRLLPTTHWTFLCGALALAGFPFLSGFWSKDEILGAAMAASEASLPYASFFRLLYWCGLFTAGLTAFYTFRAYFLTFHGEQRVPPEAQGHVHEAPEVMLVPLRILAVFAVGAGIVVEPFTHWFSRVLELHWMSSIVGPVMVHETLNISIIALGTTAAFLGIGLAWFMYVARPGLPDRAARSLHGFYELSLHRFLLDDILDALVVKPLAALAKFCRVFDLHVVDSVVDLIGHIPRLVGVMFRPMQNGLVQFYALTMVLSLTVLLLMLALVRVAGG